MIYVFREAASMGARELAEALNGRRIRNADRMRLRQGDKVIAWGEAFTSNVAGVSVLNGGPIRGKYADAETLKNAGVSTIEVARQRPVAAPARPAVAAQPAVDGTDPAVAILRTLGELADDFVDYTEDILESTPPLIVPRTQVYRDGIAELHQQFGRLLQAINQPVPVARPAVAAQAAVPAQTAGEWVGRTNNHTGGADLLTPTTAPDYFVKKETFVNEYRIHSFLGRSIRGGRKGLRDGFSLDGANGTRRASSWVRSWDGGWKINYDGETVKQRHRDIAHDAVRALGLDFGAVDIGERQDGSLVVLEVNRAPGLEGGTITVYANAVQNWANGTWTMRTREQAQQERQAARRAA